MRHIAMKTIVPKIGIQISVMRIIGAFASIYRNVIFLLTLGFDSNLFISDFVLFFFFASSLVGFWWLAFSILTLVWLRNRPGPPLPANTNIVTVSTRCFLCFM